MEDNKTESIDFSHIEAIEEPDSQAWRFNGRPELHFPKTDAERTAAAIASGWVPPEERGPEPWTPDQFLLDDPGDPAPETKPLTAEEEQQLLDASVWPEDVGGMGEPDVEDADTQPAAEKKPDEAKPKTQNGAMQPVSGFGMLVSNVSRGISASANGVKRLGALGAQGAAAGAIYSAKGAKWGWETNKQQRQTAHRKRAERTLETASGLNERLSQSLDKLGGTDYMQMAQARAQHQAKASPSDFDRKQVKHLDGMMRQEISRNPVVQGELGRIDHTMRDAQRVMRDVPAHVRKGAMSQEDVDHKIKPAFEKMQGEQASRMEGMTDSKGEDMQERIKQMVEKVKEMLRSIAALFGRKQSPAMA